MLGKILITLAVLVGAWLVIRTRLLQGRQATQPAVERAPLVPAGVPQALAYGLGAVMVAGAGLYVFGGWQTGRETTTVRVVNANTGQAVTYQVRRKDVVGRSLRTLDGRRITLADVERMELVEDLPESPE
jgi:hypothetical protein